MNAEDTTHPARPQTAELLAPVVMRREGVSSRRADEIGMVPPFRARPVRPAPRPAQEPSAAEQQASESPVEPEAETLDTGLELVALGAPIGEPIVQAGTAEDEPATSEEPLAEMNAAGETQAVEVEFAAFEVVSPLEVVPPAETAGVEEPVVAAAPVESSAETNVREPWRDLSAEAMAAPITAEPDDRAEYFAGEIALDVAEVESEPEPQEAAALSFDGFQLTDELQQLPPAETELALPLVGLQPNIALAVNLPQHVLAERLDVLSRRLRREEPESLVATLARGDQLDALIAGFLAGYIARNG